MRKCCQLRNETKYGKGHLSWTDVCCIPSRIGKFWSRSLLPSGNIALYVVADAQRKSSQPRRLFWLIRSSHQTHFRDRRLWDNILKLASRWIDRTCEYWPQDPRSSYSSCFGSFCLHHSLLPLSGQSLRELPLHASFSLSWLLPLPASLPLWVCVHVCLCEWVCAYLCVSLCFWNSSLFPWFLSPLLYSKSDFLFFLFQPVSR